ncbi:MAG: prephenate dehydrogenase/arogenate dehydrogenase family protein, partial [Dehalococcoidia bacterium]
MSTIALMGAGGKMGLRIARNLKDNTDYKTLYVEISDAGKSSLAELGLSATPQDEALPQADVVILALPDKLIGSICNDMVPKLRSGTMVMGLDPAAGYAGVLTERE